MSDKDKVVEFKVRDTTQELLDAAATQELKSAVVLGFDEDGAFNFGTNVPTLEELAYLERLFSAFVTEQIFGIDEE